MQYYAHGLQVRESAHTEDEKKASKILRKRLGAIAAGIQQDTRGLRYEDLRDSYYDDYRTNRRRSLRYGPGGAPRLDKVVRLDSYFEGFRASEITTDDIRKFIVDQQKRQLANATINRSLGALKRMFNLAKRDGSLRNAPYVPMLKEAAPRQGFFERTQYEALFESFPAYLRMPLAMAYFTAMRREEILSLEWSQVDFLAGTITLRAGETKNDLSRTIPMVPQLRTLLIEQRTNRQPHCPYVCFRPDRKGIAAKIGNFRKVWQSRCVKLGLGKMEPATDRTTGEPLYAAPRGPRSKPKTKMVYQGMIFHDLRRTGVRNLVRAGVSEKVARDISGHKTRSVFDRYNIVSSSDVEEAGRKLAAFHEVGDK
jgi:integrase